VAVDNLNISSTYISLDFRAITAQPHKHLKFTFPMVFKSLFLIEQVAMCVYVDVSADIHMWYLQGMLRAVFLNLCENAAR